jgi:hypothetical protein
LLHQYEAVIANSSGHPRAERVSMCRIGKGDIALPKHLGFEDVHGLVVIQREVRKEEVSHGEGNAKRSRRKQSHSDPRRFF